MSRSMWSPEERQEHDDLMAQVCREADATEDRVNLFEDAVADAVQSQRFWAGDVQREALRTGHREQIKGWLKAHRVVVQIKDRSVSKPRVVGVRRIADDGTTYDAQVLFEVMTWDELDAKRKEYGKQLRTYSDSVAVVDKLLFLRDLAPESGTPADACAALGTSLDEYLRAA